MAELKENPRESEFEKISELHRGSMEDLVEPIFCGKEEVRAKNGILVGSVAYRVYKFLKKNLSKAFTSDEIAKAIEERKRLVVCALHEMKKKGFIHSSEFKVNVRREGYPIKFGCLIYSLSQKAIRRRIWVETPSEVKKCLLLIENNPDKIFSTEELMNLTNATWNQIHCWLDKVYCRRLRLVKSKIVPGLNKFFYHATISDKRFEEIYSKVYRDKAIEKFMKSSLLGRGFEELALWIFKRYMELKFNGIRLELKRLDAEPVDYIIGGRLDLSELLSGDRENEITLFRFVISCKHRDLRKPLGSWYVLGFSGCLKEGRSYSGEEIFDARGSIGIILCTHATGKAYEACANTGVRMFDLPKLLRMYKVVKEKTKEETPVRKNLLKSSGL